MTATARKNGPAKSGKAAKTGAASSPNPDTVLELGWNLADLPSTQHRAGLAGLVMLVTWVARDKSSPGRVLEVENLGASGCRLRANRAGFRALFDAAYDAKRVEVSVKSKWQGAEPLRIEEVTVAQEPTVEGKKPKKPKTEKRYVYETTMPVGAFLKDEEPDGGELWIKLWRDFIWQIMRGVPAQRIPFNERAAGAYTDDADEVFDDLTRAPGKAENLASTYYLGAQSTTAEGVSFRDEARHQLLLNFWPFAVSLYLPTTIDREGKTEWQGFAVAIPDVAHLADFVFDYHRTLRLRPAEAAGFRPRAAVVDVVQEAGVDLMHRIESQVASQEAARSASDLVLAVDVIHCEKVGNNIRVHSTVRVFPHPGLGVEHAALRRRYWDPRFRRQLLRNLFAGRPWWAGFDRVIATNPHKSLFDEKSFWSHDARAAFDPHEGESEVSVTVDESNVANVTEPQKEAKSLEEIVLQAVVVYLASKLDAKHGLKWSDVKDTPGKKIQYDDKKHKLAVDAFLAVRARTGADFIAYFTGTLCSASQRMNDEAFLRLSRALLEETERVRTLTLLALSARG